MRFITHKKEFFCMLNAYKNSKYHYLNGWWYTGDTGSAVKGNVVDFFFGENVSSTHVNNFGRQNAKIIAFSKTKPEEILQ